VVALCVLAATAEHSDACWRWRFRRCYRPCPTFVTIAPCPTPTAPRVRTYLEGEITDNVGERVRSARIRAKAAIPSVTIPADDIFEGVDRKTPKTTIVHDGGQEDFQDVDELIAYFESPLRVQERWLGTVITTSTDQRNPDVELVNVTVQNAWIYEISRQKDNDYHLLIGVDPARDQSRYVNAEISAINEDSPDAKNLWELRQSFKQQYEDFTGKALPGNRRFTQPRNPIHIRVTGSIFLDADHGRAVVGHGDIKNFTSWEIHPITKIEILQD